MSSTLVIGLRLLFAGLSLAGVLTQLVIAIQTHFGVVSFFSYFTILSNIIASCVFIVSAIQLAAPGLGSRCERHCSGWSFPRST